MVQLRLARVLLGTTVEGPGLRAAVWVQGCSIRCSGCINPHLFSPRGGEVYDPVALVGQAVAHGCEGLTLLGGEPFDQAAACAELAEAGRRAGVGGITFTGHELDVFSGRDESCRCVLSATDLRVDGPYRRHEAATERGLVGAAIQRFRHLTDRYATFDPPRHPNRVDIRISPEGKTAVAGFLNGPD